MKRIQAACICQTLHFMPKDGVRSDLAKAFTLEEVQQYKKNLEKNRTHYRILEETPQPDGSIILKIVKQYNTSPVGDYLSEG